MFGFKEEKRGFARAIGNIWWSTLYVGMALLMCDMGAPDKRFLEGYAAWLFGFKELKMGAFDICR